jgi:hypothetical protein
MVIVTAATSGESCVGRTNSVVFDGHWFMAGEREKLFAMVFTTTMLLELALSNLLLGEATMMLRS